MQFIGIQYMRGFAALAVVLVHVITNVFGNSWERVLSVGVLNAGVDIFFVISGFIIWRTTEKPDLNPVSWWRSRLIRIAPLYWLALLVTLLIKHISETPMPSVMEAIKAFAFIPVINSSNGTMTPFLPPGWTLNYEFAFYGLMALTLNIAKKWRRITFLSIALLGLVALRRFADPADPIQFRMTSPLFLEFLSGIGIAVLMRSIDKSKLIRSMLGAISLASAVAFVCLATPRMFPDGPRFIYFGVPAALLVTASVCLEDQVRRRIIAPLKHLGDSSYSLYISHSLVIAPSLHLFSSLGMSNLWTCFATVALCIIVGSLTFRCIEKPLLYWLNAAIGQRRDALRAAT